jgi:hypothetical protein
MINKYICKDLPFEGMYAGALYIEVDDVNKTVTAVWPNVREDSLLSFEGAKRWIDGEFWTPYKPSNVIFPDA